MQKKQVYWKKNLLHNSMWQNDFDLDVGEFCMLANPLVSLKFLTPQRMT